MQRRNAFSSRENYKKQVKAPRGCSDTSYVCFWYCFCGSLFTEKRHLMCVQKYKSQGSQLSLFFGYFHPEQTAVSCRKKYIQTTNPNSWQDKAAPFLSLCLLAGDCRCYKSGVGGREGGRRKLHLYTGNFAPVWCCKRKKRIGFFGRGNTGKEITCFLPLFSLGSFMTDAAKRKARLPPPKSNINLRGRVHIRQEGEGGIISKV